MSVELEPRDQIDSKPAGEKGIPQVLAPGALDMVNFGARETLPAKFDGAKYLLSHSNGHGHENQC